MIKLKRLWDNFWFSPESPRNLAAARIIFAAHALWILLSRDLPAASGFPDAFWKNTTSAERFRYLLFPHHLLIEQTCWGVLVIALIAVLLGYRSHIFALVAGLMLYHLVPLQTIFWTPNPYERGFTITTAVMIVLALSECDAVWSVRKTAPVAAWEYGWPLRLIQLLVAEVYLFAGYSKIYRVGWHWIASENMRRWLLAFNEQDQIAVFHRLGLWIAGHTMLCWIIAFTAVLFDLSFVIAVFVRRARIVLVPMAVMFHFGILLTMNIAFLNVPQLLIFSDWDWISGKLGRGRASKERPEEHESVAFAN